MIKLLDFTLEKYKKLIDAISDSDYRVLTVSEYLSSDLNSINKFIILRHDVDISSDYQLEFAKYESSKGINSTYYVRCVKDVINFSVLSQIRALGHEIGYHYETLTKSNGNYDMALQIFKNELALFKKYWDTKTVSPHGGSFSDDLNAYNFKDIPILVRNFLSGKKIFSNNVNSKLWEKYDLNDIEILGDCYKSINDKEIQYFSDTGRSWNSKYKYRDGIDNNQIVNLETTEDIISLIRNNTVSKMYVLVHLEQWKNNLFDWLEWYLSQTIKRAGKKIINHN